MIDNDYLRVFCKKKGFDHEMKREMIGRSALKCTIYGGTKVKIWR